MQECEKKEDEMDEMNESRIVAVDPEDVRITITIVKQMRCLCAFMTLNVQCTEKNEHVNQPI